jgi:protein-S-isoprenylcysteine O-methyltransferase Ste14
MEIHSKKLVDCSALVVTTMLGSFSLFLFGLFLFGHSFTIIDFGYSRIGFHTLDALLCLVFFVQHSTMIRRGFRNKLTAVLPHHYHGALYTTASSAALIILVLFWQNSNQTLLSLQDESRWAAHGIFFASLMGMAWAMRALRSFDTFGVQPILAYIRASQLASMPLTIRGPYRWIRHPLYFFILVMIWSCPDVTTDRLLFNILFTVWIVLGTLFEERDLVAAFGKTYIDYRSKVPMLLPWKPHKPFPPGGIRNDFG